MPSHEDIHVPATPLRIGANLQTSHKERGRGGACADEYGRMLPPPPKSSYECPPGFDQTDFPYSF